MAATDGQRTKRRGPADFSVAVPKVGLALCNWPHNFHHLCWAWHEKVVRRRKESRYFQASFDWLFVRLHKNLDSRQHQTTFMLRAALQYGLRHWDRRPIGIKEPELRHDALPQPRYGTLADAARAINWPIRTVEHWLKQGLLPAVELDNVRGSYAKWRVDLDALRCTKITRRSFSSQQQAAQYLGIPRGTYRHLVQRGAISTQYLTDGRSYASEDLDIFRASILSKASPKMHTEECVELSVLFDSAYSSAAKAEILQDVSQGKIPVYGVGVGEVRDLEIPDVVLDEYECDPILHPTKLTVSAMARKFRLKAYEARSAFRTFRAARGRFKEPAAFIKDINEFFSEHVPISVLAEWKKMTVTELEKILAALDRSHLLRLPTSMARDGRGPVMHVTFVKRNSVAWVEGLMRQRSASRHSSP